jgi:hypothetical protein
MNVLLTTSPSDGKITTFAGCEEAAADLEVVKHLRGASLGVGVQHLQQLTGEFEGGGLKVDTPRGVGQHEAKINVNEMAHIVQQDIAVVPVLYLEQVADNAVGSHALREVALGRLTARSPLHRCIHWLTELH